MPTLGTRINPSGLPGADFLTFLMVNPLEGLGSTIKISCMAIEICTAMKLHTKI